MTEYNRTHTPPVPPVVKLRCSLHAERRPVNAGDPGGYHGPPSPDDIRGWLGVQTEEYRAEALGPGATFSGLHMQLAGERKAREAAESQLSAAAAERDEALKLPHRGTIAELRNRVKDFEIDLTAARETIQTLEACADQRHATLVRVADEKRAALETIRALTEERDKLLAGEKHLVFTELARLRYDGWMVAVHNDYMQDGERHTFWLFTKNGVAVKGEGKTDAEALHLVRVLVDAVQRSPYEPPRSEEGRSELCGCVYPVNGWSCVKERDHDGWCQAGTGLGVVQWDHDANAGPRPGERPSSDYSAGAIAIARDAGKLRVTEDGCGWIRDMKPDNVRPTRLAPLTDRERRIVAAAERWRECDMPHHDCKNKCGRLDALADAIDLPKEEPGAAPMRDGTERATRINELYSETVDLQEKLRLATEQVEALAKVQAAVKADRRTRDADLREYAAEADGATLYVHGRVVRAKAETLAAWQASDEYEAKRKERGWT